MLRVRAAGFGPSADAPPDGCRGSFRGHSSRVSLKMARQFMTHSGDLRPLIDALRNDHSPFSATACCWSSAPPDLQRWGGARLEFCRTVCAGSHTRPLRLC